MNKIGFTLIDNPDVEDVFSAYPIGIRSKLLEVRQLILDTAAKTDGVGEIEETLRWGQPSYLTPKTKSGSTIRIDTLKRDQTKFGVYFICTTNLVEKFTELYPTSFRFEDNRSIIFYENDKIPKKKLSKLISLALTYHLDKKKKK